MKKFSILFMMLCSMLFYSALNAQLPQISNIYIIPANPTTNDFVKVVVTSIFPSGGCDLTSATVSINGQDIQIMASHTLGMATYICASTDTLTLGKLEPGLHMLVYYLSCNPYPPSMDIDSIFFNVQVISGIAKKQNTDFHIFPNPVNDNLQIIFNEASNKTEVRIFGIHGELIFQQETSNNQLALNVSELSAGMYIAEISRNNHIQRQKFTKL